MKMNIRFLGIVLFMAGASVTASAQTAAEKAKADNAKVVVKKDNQTLLAMPAAEVAEIEKKNAEKAKPKDAQAQTRQPAVTDKRKNAEKKQQ